MGFSYDANGRVVKATRAATPDAQTVYDALGNRVATKVNDVWQYMIYDAFGRLVAEYGVPSEGMGGVKYVQMDHQGSVRTITNSNGFVVSRTDHQAFGDTIPSVVGLRNVNQGYGVDPSTRQSYGLTETDDASGQQHTWFRKLETLAGRWSSPDPYKGSMNIGDPQSFNRYAYVNNQPTNYVDPSGLLPICGTPGLDPEAPCSIPTRDSRLDAITNSKWGGFSLPDKPIREPKEPTQDPQKCSEVVNLPSEATDAGAMARLIFQEATDEAAFAKTTNPSKNYGREMLSIASLVQNRVDFLNQPGLSQAQTMGFGNVNATVRDVIFSQGKNPGGKSNITTQFRGFSSGEISHRESATELQM